MEDDEKMKLKEARSTEERVIEEDTHGARRRSSQDHPPLASQNESWERDWCSQTKKVARREEPEEMGHRR